MSAERRPTNRRFRVIMSALAVIAVVSGGAAYAASQDNSPQARSQAIVNDAAGTLGVDPAKLSDALKKALENQVDAQVTAGKITQAQGDAIKTARSRSSAAPASAARAVTSAMARAARVAPASASGTSRDPA